MNTKIYLGKVNFTSVQNNAGVFYGDNTLKSWQTRLKNNAALGRVNGDCNLIASRLNFINDSDIFDMVVKKQE